MLGMHAWQWAVVGVVALVSVGYMTLSMLRMFPPDSRGGGKLRPSTPLETGFIAAQPTSAQQVFDGWSYRVQGRYAGRVRVVVEGDRVSVAGPRIPFGLYVFWIWLQGLALALVPVGVVWALVAWNWRPLAVAGGCLLLSVVAMAIGAGIWPGFGETILAGEGHFTAIEVPLARISDVLVGSGWARDGMEVVIAPYKAGIDKLATTTVTFRAPDGEGHHVVYA
ncbi:MAG: hypothetical protein FDZ75_00655, partial [Actinobacteria bacterium]